MEGTTENAIFIKQWCCAMEMWPQCPVVVVVVVVISHSKLQISFWVSELLTHGFGHMTELNDNACYGKTRETGAAVGISEYGLTHSSLAFTCQLLFFTGRGFSLQVLFSMFKLGYKYTCSLSACHTPATSAFQIRFSCLCLLDLASQNWDLSCSWPRILAATAYVLFMFLQEGFVHVPPPQFFLCLCTSLTVIWLI